MRALICGSLAFDNVMTFPGRFREHILPEKIHILNVSFLVPRVRRDFGGCAGNIAYNLRLLGADPVVVGTLGRDGAEYLERLDHLGIGRDSVIVIEDELTAQAFIITDMENNQITAFHPGAMLESHATLIHAPTAAIAIVAPDGPRGMVQHAQRLAKNGIPFLFDPGQALPSLSAAQLEAFIDQATWITVNDYEAAILSNTTGRSLNDIAGDVDALIVTRGEEGSRIITRNAEVSVSAVPSQRVVDPTGCGDAYRAGLMYGMMAGLGWVAAARIGSTLATFKLEHPSGQSHKPSRTEVFKRCEETYGCSLPVS